jgi:hypothetical protein
MSFSLGFEGHSIPQNSLVAIYLYKKQQVKSILKYQKTAQTGPDVICRPLTSVKQSKNLSEEEIASD